MKKVRITESQLRGLVKRMIREEYTNDFNALRQDLSNFREPSQSLKFNLGNRVFVPQNVDIRTIAYQNDSGLWNIFDDKTLREKRADFTFFVVTNDGVLICYNPNKSQSINSAIVDYKEEFLSVINQRFKTNCTKLSTKIV
jgi:hypothetical protein